VICRVHICVGGKISEHSQFAVSVSDSLRRLQGRGVSLSGSRSWPDTRQKEYGKVQVGSLRTGSGAIHQAR